MTRRVVVHPRAATDVREAARWYDQRSPGLGRLVPTELRRVLNRVRLFPEAYPTLTPGVRHAALDRLPYVAIYVMTAETIVLIALMHVHRDGPTVDQLVGERCPP
jgi:plasmid stabilization system protein ParE